jgi:hypothetical protein
MLLIFVNFINFYYFCDIVIISWEFQYYLECRSLIYLTNNPSYPGNKKVNECRVFVNRLIRQEEHES